MGKGENEGNEINNNIRGNTAAERFWGVREEAHKALGYQRPRGDKVYKRGLKALKLLKKGKRKWRK